MPKLESSERPNRHHCDDRIRPAVDYPDLPTGSALALGLLEINRQDVQKNASNLSSSIASSPSAVFCLTACSSALSAHAQRASLVAALQLEARVPQMEKRRTIPERLHVHHSGGHLSATAATLPHSTESEPSSG